MARASASAVEDPFAGKRKLRDQLTLEEQAQSKWAAAKAFELDAIDVTSDNPRNKFLVTFPYPYMNGVLHVGHAFSLSKAEFAAAYQRLQGKRVLFPFAFHCTGMPILAAANRLKEEIELYGNPPQFPKEDDAAAAAEAGGKKKKGKAAKKKSGKTFQYQIMEEMGVPAEAIPDFRNSEQWLRYFPPLCHAHLQKFGVKADFRRSFITTNFNPYYDRFIRWQFRRLKQQGLVREGMRMTVFSPKDGQACADHDRSSGEGVGPQEYAVVKLRVHTGASTPYLDSKGAADPLAELHAAGTPVYMMAGTLRPETMYGQVNVFVLPTGNYQLVEAPSADGKSTEVWVCSDSAARNMFYQGLLTVVPEGHQEVTPDGRAVDSTRPVADGARVLGKITGWELLGRRLDVPLTSHERVFVLPLLTIKLDKATGVVTSVPSDAPDDHIALRDLRESDKLRKKFFITEDMIPTQEEYIPILEVSQRPEWGRFAAVHMVDSLGIKSQKDKDKLAEAKKEVYKMGFYHGTMITGPHAGLAVRDAKARVLDDLLASGDALRYYEPESKVMSRTRDLCVVKPLHQWYIPYGEDDWRETVVAHVRDNMNMYSPQTKKAMLDALDWLREWACTRSFGEGTRLPFDEQYLVESLSDSTIYMAYYTIAHMLQHGSLDGSGAENTAHADYSPPEAWTDAEFDYVFLHKELPAGGGGSAVPAALLARARKEFEYWYPLDLRPSGKDLVKNHLIMCLYNHAAVWKDQPDMWPRSMFANGHVLIDNQKMSKSEGNFFTLTDAIDTFSADATRFAMAAAGDGLEDANFSTDVANKQILSMAKEAEWIQETFTALAAGALADRPLASEGGDPTASEAHAFADRVFENEINACIVDAQQAYDDMSFRVAQNKCWYDMQNVRDWYRLAFSDDPAQMNARLLRRFVQAQTIMVSPFCPHWAEAQWSLVVEHAGAGHALPALVVDAPWPTPTAKPNLALSGQYTYLRFLVTNISRSVRSAVSAPAKKGKGGKGGKGKAAAPAAAADAPEPTACVVYTAEDYTDWQKKVFSILRPLYDAETKTFDAKVKSAVKSAFLDKSLPKKQQGAAVAAPMQFASWVVEQVEEFGPSILEGRVLFSEKALVDRYRNTLRSQTGFRVRTQVEESDQPDAARPRQPRITVDNDATLMSFPYDYKVSRALIVAQYTGAVVHAVPVSEADRNSSHFAQDFPVNKGAVLYTPHVALTQASAIARHLASEVCATNAKGAKELLEGRSPAQGAAVDNWDEWAREVEVFVDALVVPTFGWSELVPATHKAALADLCQLLKGLDQVLEDRTYLAGTDAVSLADISVATALVPVFRLFIGKQQREKQLQNVTRWMETLVAQPEFEAVLGTVSFCDTPVSLKTTVDYEKYVRETGATVAF